MSDAMLELAVVRDPVHAGEWRVEYFDDDGGCYVTIFSGPEAEQRARGYHAALSSGAIEPETQKASPGARPGEQLGVWINA